MTKRKSHSGEGENGSEFDETEMAEDRYHRDVAEYGAKTPEDPNAAHEYTVLTDGAVFPKDKLSMRKADVPAPVEKEGDHVTCSAGDVVSLTLAEAKAKRDSGIALAERPEPTESAPA